MSEAVVAVRISEPLLTHASRQAQRTGMSLEAWLVAVAEDRVRDEQVEERFFRTMPHDLAARAIGELLDRSGKYNPPEPGDELPEGYVPS